MNRAKSIYGTVLASIMFFFLATIGPLRARAQEPREPLVKAEVIRLLENGVSPDRVGALAKQYGIAFQITEDSEKQLRPRRPRRAAQSSRPRKRPPNPLSPPGRRPTS
jgi:hypothetical protein